MCREILQQSLRRLSNRLVELGAWRDREYLRIPGGEIRTEAEAPWQPLKEGDMWPVQGEPVEFRLEVLIPERWKGLPVRCRFRLGGEALLFINGQAAAGLNPFHEEHQLSNSAFGGERISFYAQAVSHGLFGTPTEHRFESAGVLVPDADVRVLYDDLAATLDAARYLDSVGRTVIAETLMDAVHRTFTRVWLPRGATDEYLARLAGISQSRSAENFYGNQESLASLWERWSFSSPAASLPIEDRKRLREARAQFNAELDEVRKRFPAEGGIKLTGHAHIDLAWLWPLEETRRKVRRTFHTVTGLLDKYPELYFNQSSAQVYAWVEHDDPELFEEIKRYVRTGRWEIVGGMWVEPDGNLPSGESWVRQLLFGQRYFQSRFGCRAKVAWLPDSFGFNGGLPQLLLSAGIPYFFTHKLSWNETNPFPYDLYWWEGIDGSRVLAHSFFNPDTGYNARLTAQELGETWRNFRGKRLHDSSLLSFGYGDGGGGPSDEMLERFYRYRDFPGLPRAEIGRVTEFYEKIQAESLPIWVGEQYLEFHRATFTTQARVKSLHRRLEHALVDAETAATLASILWGRPYPRDELQRLWRVHLLHEFHDILPGSSIHTVYEAAHRELTSALDHAERLPAAALAWDKSLQPGIDQTRAEYGSLTGTDASYRIWNLQLYGRKLIAEIPAGPSGQWPALSGNELLAQRLETGRFLVAAGHPVPALSAVSISWAAAAPASAPSDVRVNSRELENDELRIRLNEDGTIGSIEDKRLGREILADRGNQLWLYTDIPRQFDAWDIDHSYPDEGWELPATDEPEVVEAGPVRAAVRVTRRYDGIQIVQDYRVTNHSRLVEIHTKIRWQGRRRFLRALFPLQVRTHEVWADTAFGAVPRSNHRNTPWDQARFEIPAHRWVDLSESDYGVSLLSNAQYGYSAHGNVLGISLLRSPIYPDPYADEGDHEFTYALYPHDGDWRHGTIRAAQEIHSPFVTTPAGRQTIPDSLFQFKQDPLCLAAFKKAEDSDDIILRLYEAHGGRGQTVLETAVPLRRAAFVNILEDELGEIQVENGNRISFPFTPFRVISLRLSLGG
ncbi:MAG: alpha-mannosidase [Verrucomicrobia bacterium]|nr:alpha-mannosidase [Verrucomicrobiota bacterium]